MKDGCHLQILPHSRRSHSFENWSAEDSQVRYISFTAGCIQRCGLPMVQTCACFLVETRAEMGDVHHPKKELEEGNELLKTLLLLTCCNAEGVLV
jgi:hypothetical protein